MTLHYNREFHGLGKTTQLPVLSKSQEELATSALEVQL